MEPLFEFSGIAITLAEVLIGILLLIIGAALAVIFRPKADGKVTESLSEMARQQAELQGRLSQFAQDSTERDAKFRESLNNRLGEVTDRVGRSLSEQGERTSDQMKKLHERLALIDQAQKTLDTLSGEVVGLQSLLSNKQARGAFGEHQMQELLSEFLPSSRYSLQATLSNGRRVDALIHMPEGHGNIAIDSKFPLESWRALMDTEGGADQTLLVRQFSADVLKHVKDIADRYVTADDTNEVALMFIPSEAIYAELHSNYEHVVKKAFSQRVMIVSPTTFMATLHTIKSLMKDAAMREQAHIIQREVGVLATDVERLDSRVEKLQTHFRQASKDVDDIRISTNKILSRSDKIAAIDVPEEDDGSAVPKIKGAG